MHYFFLVTAYALRIRDEHQTFAVQFPDKIRRHSTLKHFSGSCDFAQDDCRSVAISLGIGTASTEIAVCRKQRFCGQ
jgi:hypothetical protein